MGQRAEIGVYTYNIAANPNANGANTRKHISGALQALNNSGGNAVGIVETDSNGNKQIYRYVDFLTPTQVANAFKNGTLTYEDRNGKTRSPNYLLNHMPQNDDQRKKAMRSCAIYTELMRLNSILGKLAN